MTLAEDGLDLFDVSGKRAVVTGGASGIGLMIAEGLVRVGAAVIIASRKEDALREASERLSIRGSCSYVVADLSTEAGCESLASTVAERWESLDILVNNVGATWGAPMAEHDAQSWSRVLGVNLEGVFHTTKFLTPLLKAAGRQNPPARVINIGSMDGVQVPSFHTYSYSASKAAVHQLTRHLAKNLAPEITVNAIAPGVFESRMMRSTIDAAGEAMQRRMPLGRIGTPEDMSGAAIFLSSRAGAFVTGAVIPVDGGAVTTR